MRDWAELWHQFIATLAHQPVGVVLVVWTGLALVVVMALEGLLLNLFPGSVFQRYLEKMPERKRKSAIVPPASAPAPKMASVAVSPPIQAATPPEPEIFIAGTEKTAEPIAKTRMPKSRNRKKPAPGPKSVRLIPGRRQGDAFRIGRFSGASRLLPPKN